MQLFIVVNVHVFCKGDYRSLNDDGDKCSNLLKVYLGDGTLLEQLVLMFLTCGILVCISVVMVSECSFVLLMLM